MWDAPIASRSPSLPGGRTGRAQTQTMERGAEGLIAQIPGLTVAQIAEVHAISLSAAKQRLRRGAMLVSLLAETGGGRRPPAA